VQYGAGGSVAIAGGHRQEQLVALLDVGRRPQRASFPLQVSLQIREEVVSERVRGQPRHRQPPAVVIERRIDDETRNVAGLLAGGQVLEASLAVELALQYLDERLSRSEERRVGKECGSRGVRDR